MTVLLMTMSFLSHLNESGCIVRIKLTSYSHLNEAFSDLIDLAFFSFDSLSQCLDLCHEKNHGDKILFDSVLLVNH